MPNAYSRSQYVPFYNRRLIGHSAVCPCIQPSGYHNQTTRYFSTSKFISSSRSIMGESAIVSPFAGLVVTVAPNRAPPIFRLAGPVLARIAFSFTTPIGCPYSPAGQSRNLRANHGKLRTLNTTEVWNYLHP